jgi:hypothetical protein
MASFRFSQLTNPGARVVAKSTLLFSEVAQDSIGFTLHTDPSTLANQDLIVSTKAENRPEDAAWATQKLAWLWAQAFPTEPRPHIELEWDRDNPKQDYSDIFIRVVDRVKHSCPAQHRAMYMCCGGIGIRLSGLLPAPIRTSHRLDSPGKQLQWLSFGRRTLRLILDVNRSTQNVLLMICTPLSPLA